MKFTQVSFLRTCKNLEALISRNIMFRKDKPFGALPKFLMKISALAYENHRREKIQRLTGSLQPFWHVVMHTPKAL